MSPATTSGKVLGSACPSNLARDVPLLCQRQSRVGRPIQHQARGEKRKHNREDYRHGVHHLSLQGVHTRGRRESLGENHEDRVQCRQYEIRISLGKIIDPEIFLIGFKAE